MVSEKAKPIKSRAPAVVVEDDVDDLDDVLQEFSKPIPQEEKPPPGSSSSKPSTSNKAPKKPAGPEPPPTAGADDDFERELMEGMEKLMAELAGGAAGADPSKKGEGDMDPEALRKAWEAMMIGDLEGDGGLDTVFEEFKGSNKGSGGSAPAPVPGNNKAGEDEFQETIRKTMEKLRNSDDTLKADAAAGDPMDQLLAAFGKGDGGDNVDIQDMLEGMMSQLMSKDLLYEPLKELHDKFPEYLSKNASTLPPEDLKKYRAQQDCVAQTIRIFEAPSYSDEDPEKSALILKMMNDMQSLGSPPTEIMGDLPPGFALGPDGLPSLDGQEGCVIS